MSPVNTVQVDPVAIKTAGELKTMNVRVSRSKHRVNWDGVPYRSYESRSSSTAAPEGRLPVRRATSASRCGAGSRTRRPTTAAIRGPCCSATSSPIPPSASCARPAGPTQAQQRQEPSSTNARLSALAATAALASGSALAQQAGNWQVGAGWLHFAPQDSSKPLTFTAPVPAVVPGSGASVGSSDTLGLNLTYFVDSHWAVEGVIGIPPKFKLDGKGTLGPVGELGEARQWSPTVLAKYYFNDGDAKFRPFVGLGATYVWYSDVKLTPGLQSAAGQPAAPAAGHDARPRPSSTTPSPRCSTWARPTSSTSTGASPSRCPTSR